MTEPIRILQVMASLDRGGAEAVVMDWLRRIDRGKVIFDFVVNEGGSYAFEQEAVELGARVFRAPRFRGWNAVPYALWWRGFLSNHPEWSVVHGHHTVPGFIYLNVARRLGRIGIAHSHTAGRDESLRGLMRTVLRLPLRYVADVHMACSREAGEWMFGRKASVRVIPNGIDTERFAFDQVERMRVRRELGYDESLVVGHVGSFSKPKNHKRMLRIFAALAEREPSARLLLVGDGGLRDEIEQDIRALRIDEKVHLAGVREDIPAILSAMDILLFPSFYEGLPVSLVEAQASGLLCVVSDRITREVDLTGLLVYCPLDGSDDVWVDALMAANDSLPRASRADELREAGYDSSQVADDLSQLYLGLIAGVSSGEG